MMEDWLKLAKEDLDTSGILYRKQKYSYALYHYHQSVEKTMKYIGLSTGKISEKQLIKDIRHDPINVFRWLFRIINEQYAGLLPPVNPNFFEEAEQLIRVTSEDQLINQVIDSIKTVCNDKKIIDEDKYPSHLDAIQDYVSKTFPDMARNFEFKSELHKQYTAVALRDKIVDAIIFVNYGLKILYILLMHSLLCWKYKPDSFRYTNAQVGNPMEHFNHSNPIVIKLPSLLKTMNFAITLASDINWKQYS
jgi:hypothetical protein